MCHTSEFGITIYDVLTLGGAQQVGRPSQKGEIKVLCPRGVKTSRGKTATFDVNLAKGNFKCYRECSDCTGHGGMQIRFDVAKESGKRYLWFSSAGYEDGCSARNITSYGAPGLMPAVGSGRLVFVTEGALKAAAANVLDAKHHPIIAIGGVSCYGQWEETCRYLQSKNIHFVADAFDSDRETNASVQKSLEKLYSIAAQYGIRMQRCDWGTAQKGVDDFLLGAAVQTDDGVILSSLWDPRNFVPPVRYIKKNIPAMFKPPVYKPKHTA